MVCSLLEVLGFELKTLHMLGKYSAIGAMPSIFFLVFFFFLL
jgi:hypothetical protein